MYIHAANLLVMLSSLTPQIKILNWNSSVSLNHSHVLTTAESRKFTSSHKLTNFSNHQL